MNIRFAAAASLIAGILHAQTTTETRYLSGTDKDHTVAWEFFMSSGQQAGKWTTIPVPSNWELQKFGTYSYGRDVDPPDRGQYRHRFTVPAAWRGRSVRLVFDGVMTDAAVTVNGTSAGPTHQGGYYRFAYDVTSLLKYGAENALEVTVDEKSADSSVNRAERMGDFWVFGGIYRPVYLEALPAHHVERVAVDARADGTIRVDAFVVGAAAGARATAQVLTLDRHPLGAPFSATVRDSADVHVATVRGRVAGAKPWTAETPNRYRVRVTLADAAGRAEHTVTETIGFRTIEVRPRDGIYVNGTKVRLKGVNRHTFWPEAGRTTSRAISEMDASLMKEMNMNAVRMSHYPPDAHFLDVADSVGLYVLDELTGWQRNYDTPIARKLVRELVVRDVNHPAIILWDNGNEGGFNFDVDGDFARWDPQARKVMHPWALHDGVNTAHYRPLACCAGRVFNGRDIVMPTELQHGLYDGGHGAGLRDYWTMMLANPRAAGMFLWDLVDQGVLRTDLPNDTLDTEGNRGADGIVGPHREKEASYFTIRKLWSPIALVDLDGVETLPPTFDGRVRVENRYDFTHLDRASLAWQLVRFPGPADRRDGHTVVARGTAKLPDVAPGMRGDVHLALPNDWRASDALYLTATGPDGRALYTWSWMIAAPRQVAARTVVGAARGTVTATESADRVTLAAGDLRVQVDRATGRLVLAERGGVALPLANGPRLVGGTEGKLTSLTHRADGDAHVVEATYEGPLKRVRWRLQPNGWLALDYQYELQGEVDAAGITFDFPESQVTGMRWLGRGPYRVWKNRLDGVEYDVWRKAYNDAVTGLVWQYPEFKGFHANLHWAVLETKSLPLTVATPDEDLFLRVFTPRVTPRDDRKMTPAATGVDFPPGDLSFLNAIPPIGNKFTPAEQVSPSGRKNLVQRSSRGTELPDYQATVWLYFGEVPAASR